MAYHKCILPSLPWLRNVIYKQPLNWFFQKYQNSLSENDAFEIVHADGDKILVDMTNKISKIFDKNIAALKVKYTQAKMCHVAI